MQKKVLIISTGGTIAGEVEKTIIQDENIKKSDEFADVLKNTIASIKSVNKIDVILEHHPLAVVDSSDILPQHWTELAGVIKEKYDDFDAFIITHGTNTLGYTCAALSFALPNVGKPVILTGSQVPAGMPGSDAISNLENALRVSVLHRANDPNIIGIVAVFGSRIITGTNVKKDTEFDYDAFKSFNGRSIGRIGRIIDIDDEQLRKHLSYLATSKYPLAKSADKLICDNKFDTRIVSLTEFPGMSADIFKTLVEKHEIKGFILRAFGAGDASTHLRKAFEFLKDRGIPIVVTSQAPNGNSNFQVNEPGANLAKDNLAIPAHDMSIESITTKLAWLLASDMDYQQVCKSMIEDYHGEIRILWEVKM